MCSRYINIMWRQSKNAASDVQRRRGVKARPRNEWQPSWLFCFINIPINVLSSTAALAAEAVVYFQCKRDQFVSKVDVDSFPDHRQASFGTGHMLLPSYEGNEF
jgi:hypothetical protein